MLPPLLHWVCFYSLTAVTAQGPTEHLFDMTLPRFPYSCLSYLRPYNPTCGIEKGPHNKTVIFVNECELYQVNRIEYTRFVWHPLEECLRLHPELNNVMARLCPKKYTTAVVLPTQPWYSDESIDKPKQQFQFEFYTDDDNKSREINVMPMKYVATTVIAGGDGDGDDDDDEAAAEDKFVDTEEFDSRSVQSDDFLFEEDEYTETDNSSKYDNETYESYHSSIGILDYTSGDDIITNTTEVFKNKSTTQVNVNDEYHEQDFTNVPTETTADIDIAVEDAVSIETTTQCNTADGSNIPDVFGNDENTRSAYYNSEVEQSELSSMVTNYDVLNGRSYISVGSYEKNDSLTGFVKVEKGNKEYEKLNETEHQLERTYKEGIKKTKYISSADNTTVPSRPPDLTKDKDTKRKNNWFRLFL